jgi:predicted anti-sigma-YlaC factor YlaD
VFQQQPGEEPLTPECKEVRSALARLDGPADADAVESHLDHCVACGLAAQGFERLDALLALEAHAPEPLVPVDVMASVRAELARRRGLDARWSRAWSAVAVAAAVALVCGLLALADAQGWRAPVEEAAATLGLVALPESLGLLDLDLSALSGSLSLGVPAPSVAVLLLGSVAVLALNLTLCRAPGAVREAS